MFWFWGGFSFDNFFCCFWEKVLFLFREIFNKILIMVHTIYNNDEIDVKKLPKEKNRYNNVMSGVYVSSEEFRKRAIEKVNKFCDKHGIL